MTTTEKPCPGFVSGKCATCECPWYTDPPLVECTCGHAGHKPTTFAARGAEITWPWEELPAEDTRERDRERARRAALRRYCIGQRSTRYNNVAVQDELEILRTTTSSRNPQCNISALKLARLPGIDREWLREQLIDVMHANGSVRDNGMRSVQATISSAFSKADKDGPRDA